MPVALGVDAHRADVYAEDQSIDVDHYRALLRAAGRRSLIGSGARPGGRQALTEAQRFPADYNGIIAGAPANFLTHLQASSVWKAQAIRKHSDGLIPPSKLALIHKEVVAACDARDGVKDGLLEDPRLCDFDPETLECQISAAMLQNGFVDRLRGLGVKYRAAVSVVDRLRKPGGGDNGASCVVIDRRTGHQSVEVFRKSLCFQEDRLPTL